MSLFIGRNIESQNSLIVSRQHKTFNEMKSSVSYSPDIVFNSKFPYVVVEHERITNAPYVSYTSNSQTMRQYTLNPSSYFSNKWTNNGDERLVLIIKNGVIVSAYNAITNNNNSTYFDEIFGAYVDTFRYSLPNTSITVYTQDISSSPVFDIVLLPFTIGRNDIVSSIYGGEIKVSSNELLINNNDFFKNKYIINGTINSIDATFTMYGQTYQIVNSLIPQNSSLSISGNNSTNVIIKRGDYTVLDSSISSYVPMITNELSQYLHYYSNNFYFGVVGYANTFIPTNAVAGEIYIVNIDLWFYDVNGTKLSRPKRTYIIKVGNSSENIITMYGGPCEVYGTGAIAETLFIDSAGNIGFGGRFVYCTGAPPVDGYYYGPYNIEVYYKRIG